VAFEKEHVLVSETAIRTRDRIREITRGLPEAEEKIDGFGHTTFRVRDKSFVMMGEGEKGGGGSFCFKSDKETQQLLIQKGPYYRTAYIGQHGWVSINCSDIADWNELSELIVEAYLRAAPKRLVQAYRQG
jgi:hypothetical protein